MASGVFIHRSDSVYDDSPAERYQFPRQYLGRVRACVQDWILYYEPRKVHATRGYFAVARLQEVTPDPASPEMYLAIIEPGTYLDFSHPVPFMLDGQIVERGVLNLEGKLSGRAQSAVRPISTVDFQRILKLGLGEDAVELPRVDVPLSYGMREEQMPFGDGADRDRIRYLGSRVLRDRVFRNVVLRAYSSRCAVTGLKLINGGGRAEVEAAHIRSVEKGGPDIVSNGVALSGTAQPLRSSPHG